MLVRRLEDEMDVSALNLGMIAAYYNISCESLDAVWMSQAHDRSRCHGRGVHTFLKKVQNSRASRGGVFFCRVRKHPHSSSWGCPIASCIWSCSSSNLDRVDFEAPHFKTFLLFKPTSPATTTSWSRSRPSFGLGESTQFIVGLRWRDVFQRLVERHTCNGLVQMCVQAMWDTEYLWNKCLISNQMYVFC